MSNARPNLDDLYAVLRGWAASKSIHTYLDLSRDYQARTGDWFVPHGTWDKPLGEMNMRLNAAAAPALSALVVKKDTNEPGGGFWGCAPNVPPRPGSDIERLTVWQRIVQQVHAYSWPGELP